MRTDIHATMIADSISPAGVRLSTLAVRMPKQLVAQFNTHRAFSRNSASSRAVPVARVAQQVEVDPFEPDLTIAGRGMVSTGEVDAATQAAFRDDCLALRDAASAFALKWSEVGHKQNVNRYLEPWMYSTVLVSATEWDNFFAQRDHIEAQPEMRTVARAMRSAIALSIPRRVEIGDWHTPFVDDLDRGALRLPDTLRVSVGRCARVSYLTHDGRRDYAEDVALFTRMVQASPPHWSPLEHLATPTVRPDTQSGNFTGWTQLRHASISLQWLIP